MIFRKGPWTALILAPLALALLLPAAQACNRGGRSTGGSGISPGLLQQQMLTQQMMLLRQQQTLQQYAVLSGIQQRQLAGQQLAVLAASLKQQQAALQKALNKTTASLTALEQAQGTPTASTQQKITALRKKQTRLETALEKTKTQLSSLKSQGILTTAPGR